MVTQSPSGKYKLFNLGSQNPLSIISNDTVYPTSSHNFLFSGPERMLAIAFTKDLKEGVKSLVCTEHTTSSNSEQ